MLPFIRFFGLDIPSYGICILIGVIIGVLFALFVPAKKSIAKEDLLFSVCYAGIGVFLGAKLLYLLTAIPLILKNWDLLLQNPSLILGLLSGGFVFYGGVIGGFVGIVIYTKKYEIDTIDALDVLTPSIPLVHAFGRLGCFMAGCCYGIPTDPPLGLLFDKSPVAPHDVYLFPVQLLESCLNFLLFIVLFIFARRTKGKGTIFILYLLLYAIERFILEYFRFDSERGFFLWFSTSQWISIVIILGCIFFYLAIIKTKKS